jgi:hypothetical protein
LRSRDALGGYLGVEDVEIDAGEIVTINGGSSPTPPFSLPFLRAPAAFSARETLS